MRYRKANNLKEWIDFIDQELVDFYNREPKDLKIYLPAGNTPKPLYQSWRENPPVYLKNAELLQIDEVLDGSELFANFFKEELSLKVEPLDGADVQADIAILGLGTNGHVGFHEPGIADTFYSGCVALSEESIRNLNLKPGTWGETYGLGAFCRCKLILLIVRGPSKRSLMQDLLQDKTQLPAQFLMKQPQLVVIDLE